MTVDAADACVSALVQGLRLFHDERGVFDNWRKLVLNHDVKGKPSHDARIVAAMHQHGIEMLLTFNGADFKRFDGVQILTPQHVVDRKSNK